MPLLLQSFVVTCGDESRTCAQRVRDSASAALLPRSPVPKAGDRLANGRNLQAKARVCVTTAPVTCESKIRVCPHPASHFQLLKQNHVPRQSLPRQERPRSLQRGHRDPDERRPDQVRGGQGIGRDLRRPLHDHGDALPDQLRLRAADHQRRRRPGRRAGDHARAADSRRGGAVPPDRHPDDGRRGRRRRQGAGRADRQGAADLHPLEEARRREPDAPEDHRATSSSTTRTWKPASGSRCWAGKASTPRRRKSLDGIADYKK